MEKFENGELLQRHDDQEVACEWRRYQRNYADGFDNVQKEELKKRNLRKNGDDEYSYWQRVYKLLFPDKEDSEIPYPGTGFCLFVLEAC